MIDECSNRCSLTRQRNQPRQRAAVFVQAVATSLLAFPLTASAGSTIFGASSISDDFGVDFSYTDVSAGSNDLASLMTTVNGGSVQDQLAGITVSTVSTSAFAERNANGRSTASLNFRNTSTATGLDSMDDEDVLEIFSGATGQSFDAVIALSLSNSTTFQWDLSFIESSWGGQVFIDIDDSLTGANGGPIEDLMIDDSLAGLSNSGTFDLPAGSHLFVFNTLASDYAFASNSGNELSLTSGFELELERK